jgi:hypothetical protein
MQVIHELLIQTPGFAAIGSHHFHEHAYGKVNVPADAASRAMATLLHSVTQQLGIVALQIPLPERALALLNRALDAIQAAQADEYPVPTPTRQVLGDAPQDLSEDDEVVWLQTLPAAPQVDAPFMLPADDDGILCDADYDSASEDIDLSEDTERITWNRDTQDVVGNGDLARGDVVWDNLSPKFITNPLLQSYI